MNKSKLNIKIIFILLFSIVGYGANSQNVSDVFTATEITWYGLDFSNAKMKGAGLESPQFVKDNLFKMWNDAIQKEKSKFNLRGFLKKKVVMYDLGVVEAINSTVNPENLITTGEVSLDISILGSVVKSFNINSGSGVGLVFNVESFDKIIGKASVYVTFFDISSKKILFSEKMVGNGGGAGTKSFWVNAMFHIFEQIDRKKYGPWKKEFGAMTGTAYNYPDADINNNSQQKTVKQDNVIQKTTNNIEENKEVKNTPVKTVKVDYTKLSTEELKTQLDKALATEDYKNAALIQQELDNRSKVDKYSSMPIEELNKQLKVALENEEYEKAAAIQAELDKRK